MVRDFFSCSVTFSHSRYSLWVGLVGKLQAQLTGIHLLPLAQQQAVHERLHHVAAARRYPGTEMPSEERMALCLRNSTSSTMPSI